MSFLQNDNSGTLFKNDKREKETHPNAKGAAVINGVEYWVSAWTKKDKNGNLFQSLSFKKKEQAQKPAAQPVAQSNPFDDDNPF